MSTRFAVLGFAILCTAMPAAAQTTFPIDVHSAYLHIDRSDVANGALAIDLGALGILPSYTILLEPVGDWNAGPGGDVQTGLLAVFSSNATLLSSSERYRVPGAISAGPTNFSGGTWPNGEPTDILEDFYFLSPGISVVVPTGAKYLFVSVADIYYTDNSDPDGDLAVRITVTSTTGVAPGSSGAEFALLAEPNPFRSGTSLAFRVERSSDVRLRILDIAGRTVRLLMNAKLPPGDHHARWDGRDASGRQAPAGSYFARLEMNGRVKTTRMVLVR